MVGAETRCAVCDGIRRSDEEHATVCSNVRAFRDERFGVWRCHACSSIHATERVALDRYYARYPFHDLPTDGRLRILYANQLGRLRRAGLSRAHRVLDYGCGDGRFVSFLRSRGYAGATGYDPYCDAFADGAVLDKTYDFIVSQDSIEHVESPPALLDLLDRVAAPGAGILIGTPDASAIDLGHPDAFVHALHAPYHRHILSRRALCAAGERRGWGLERFYPTMYSNTRWPFLNERFYGYYLALTDGTLDALVEPVRVARLLARLPQTLFYGFFGSLFSRRTDVAALFRKAKRPADRRS